MYREGQSTGVENADVHQCYPSASSYMHLWNKFEFDFQELWPLALTLRSKIFSKRTHGINF